MSVREKTPDAGDRILAHAKGTGVGPASVHSVAGNPFLGRSTKKADKSAVLIKDGSPIDGDLLIPFLGKRIARIVAQRFDFTIHFTDGSSLTLSDGGDGLEALVLQKEKETKRKE